MKKGTSKLYWYGVSGEVLVETDTAGNNPTEYVFFNGQRIARRDPNGTVYYYFEDHLGTSRVMVQAGQNTACYDADFYPYGGERVITNSCAQNYKFTGKERDTESGNDYFGARYYASNLGRFLSVDPSMESVVLRKPQTWNRYSYTVNNPLRYIDPTGELWVPSPSGGGAYTWVDKCSEGQTCYVTAAMAVDGTVRIYGSKSAEDIKNYEANKEGYVDLSEVAKHPDAAFEFKSGVDASYLSLEAASGFFNLTAHYASQYSGDDKIFATQAGTADGSDTAASKEHDSGRSIDVRYMDTAGKAVQGEKAIGSADPQRVQTLIDAAYSRGFTRVFTGSKSLTNATYDKTGKHASHLHLGRERPPNK